MSRPVAFFDIDGTLFRSSLLVELFAALVAEGIFPAAAAEEYAPAHQAWQDREGTYEEYIAAVIASYTHHIKGVHYGTVADIGRLVVAAQHKRVYRYTRDRIQALARDGYALVAISQSPKTILDEFCRPYKFDKVYGRMYEIGPTDRFTGAVIDEHLISSKATIVTRVCSQSDTELEQSVAVGDTEGDISMLELVAEPTCFNPNQTLLDHARRMGWPVVVERKDVIYELG